MLIKLMSVAFFSLFLAVVFTLSMIDAEPGIMELRNRMSCFGGGW